MGGDKAPLLCFSVVFHMEKTNQRAGVDVVSLYYTVFRRYVLLIYFFFCCNLISKLCLDYPAYSVLVDTDPFQLLFYAVVGPQDS